MQKRERAKAGSRFYFTSGRAFPRGPPLQGRVAMRLAIVPMPSMPHSIKSPGLR